MEIIKAKVTKDKTLVATYKDETGTVTIEGKNLVTFDLTNAFDDLIPHIAFLCEQKEADGKDSMSELPDNIASILEVTGYSLGGDGDSAGVTLIGKRFLKSNKVLNLIAPFTMFNGENEQYHYNFELEQAIQACEYEVKEYLFNKKWRVVQQELPFLEDDATVAEVRADSVPEAETSSEMADFKQAMEDAGVTVIMNGKKIKPRKSRKVKQLAS